MAKYILPIASDKDLGGIKVGDDFEIDQEGRLNVKDMDQMRQTVESLSQQVTAGKALIASAITTKKVNTDSNASFQTMADNVLKIRGGVSYERISNENKLVPYKLIEEG